MFFFSVQTFCLYYIWLFWTLQIEKTRRLNFVSFSGLENNETNLSETKLSGDSIHSLALNSLEIADKNENDKYIVSSLSLTQRLLKEIGVDDVQLDVQVPTNIYHSQNGNSL